MSAPGQIIILNGAPRSGKSSIAAAIQETFPGVWMNLGVDAHIAMTPAHHRPGIGLRPGGERREIEALVPILYAALYDAIAAHSRHGLNVVVDVGHHDAYGERLGILPDCARRLSGLPVLFVGVHCPIEIILQRRSGGEPAGFGSYVVGSADDPVPEPVALWQREVYKPGIYDLEVDTSRLSPVECAEAISYLLERGVRKPTAFERIAEI